MNNFLKSRADVDAATKYLEDNNLISSGLSCKNWEAKEVIPFLNDGDLIDLGSLGSVVLDNAVRRNISGRKVGIDLAYKEDYIKDGVELFKGDLMNTHFADEAFDLCTCLSVIEHQVDISKFVGECYRILKHGGQMIVSFDYWPSKINTKGVLLYNLEWNIMDVNGAWEMINKFLNQGFELTSEVDWTIEEAVITDKYCSPAAGISYTFGILNFIKK